MSENFTTTTCDHCGSDIDSAARLHRLGKNTVHKRCVDEFVDITPKIELTPHTCNECYRSFWTAGGLEHHRGRDACV